MPSSRGRSWATAIAALATACGSRTELDVRPDAAGASAVDGTTQPLGCTGTTEIYAISNMAPPFGLPGDGELYAFDPRASEFKDLGVVACPADGLNTVPASMAIDRQGTAYIPYLDGSMFRVSTRTLACETTGFAGQDLQTPGIAFVANPSAIETLFLAQTNPSALATVDQHTFTTHRVALFSNPDLQGLQLTGTGDGRLYGLYAPHGIVAPAYIVQIDPASAEIVGSFTLDIVLGAAWALAFWAGDFYVFAAPAGAPSIVERYRPSDGSVVHVATAPSAVLIAGAGVSTCAPLR
jgi:hypothetical protein